MPSIEILTLADHRRDAPRWWKHCNCGRSAEIDVAGLIERLGGDYLMSDYRDRAKCKECGAVGLKGGVVVHCPSTGLPGD